MTLPPSRDAFGLALSALRLRLRSGVDAPGAALPINLIAAALRLSPTPVREALSRLAGEDLVDKQGPGYLRPRLDGECLAGLYNLRWLYLREALRPAPSQSSPFQMTTAGSSRRDDVPQAADVATSTSAEALFDRLLLATDDPVLAQAYRRTAERLAPYHSVEAQVFPSPPADLAAASNSR